MRFLVTAGSTLEKIDTVRVWGNIFTGNTGLGIAKAIAELGEVDLLTSNRAHVAELGGAQATAHRINASSFNAHSDLRDSLANLMRTNQYDAIFMSAAVSDYRPVRVFAVVARQPSQTAGQEQWIVQDVQAGKVKSNHGTIAVLGEQTEKLVDLFRREWNYRGLLVKFKLEVGISPEALIRIGQGSRVASGAEYLVANTLDMVEGEKAGAYLLSERGEEWVARAQLPARMLKLVRESLNSRSSQSR
jgi:phosphopantothenoylcysteine synthetase/decarboxylase